MANNVSNKTVSIFIDQTAAETALDSLQRKATGFSDKIEQARKRQKELNEQIVKIGPDGKGIEKLDKEYQKLDKEIKANTKSVTDNAAAQKKLQDAIDNGLRPSFAQQERLVTSLRNQLKQLSQDAPGYAEKFKSFQSAKTQLDQLKVSMEGAAKVQKNWFADAKTVAFGVLISNTVQSAIQAIGGYLSGIVSGNAKLSDSLSDVEKATGLTSAQVANLNSQLSKIDTRTSTENLRQIAIGLGQIGEAATAENVAAIDKIVVALGDEFGGNAKEITTTLSILRNNLQDIKTGDYGTDVARIGNALNVLGAQGLATAPVVTDFANRMAGIATTFGLTSGQILGTSATFQELGINVERGSTAFTKILQKIAAEPEKFAKVAKVGVKEFTDLVNTDLLGAFEKVAVGAKTAGSSNVVFAQILKELDTDGSGAGEVLSKLANNQNLLREKVGLASDALTNQTSITDEFAKKNNNLAAELEKLGKVINSALANSTLTTILTGLVSALTSLFGKTKEVTDQFREQNAVVTSLEKNTVPLINRVDELNKKSAELGGTSKLSKDEQVELNKAIVAIGSTIPGAITQFDAYGRAIGISTEKARDFIALQQTILKEKNREAITDQAETLRKLQSEANAVIKSLNTRNAAGDLVQEVISSGSGTGVGISRIVKLTDDQIKGRQNQLAALQDRITGIKGIIQELNGENLKVPEASKAVETPEIIVPAINPFGTEEDNKKRNEQFEKAQSELKKLTEDFNKLSQSAFAFEFDKIFKDKAETEKLFREQFSGQALTDALDLLQKTTEQKVIDLNKNLAAKAKETPVTIDLVPEFKEEDVVAIKRSMEAFLKTLGEPARNEAAQRALALLNGDNAQRRDATIGNLDAEEEKELSNTELLESEKEVIRAKYRQARAQADFDFVNAELENIQEVLSYAARAVEIFARFDQAKVNRENAALKTELEGNEQRKKSLKNQLDNKLISQKAYQSAVDKLDAEADRKKQDLERKQFERNKKIQITQALINGAMAVVATLAARPGSLDILSLGAFRAINIGIVAATTLAQVAEIASKKYGRGGKLTGPSHSDGGMPVINPVTGHKEAEVEGGEYILSKKTVANNRAIADQLLYNSMYRNGEPLRPSYASRPNRYIDYGGIQKAYTYIRWADGGRVPENLGGGNNAAASQPAANNNALADTLAAQQSVLEYLANTMVKLESRLAKGIDAKISSKQIKDDADQQARINNNATFR